MLSGKVLDEFEVNGKKAEIRYEKMRDAEGVRNLFNSLVEEKAKIQTQEKDSKEEAIEKVGNALIDIEKEEGIYLVLEVDGKMVGLSNIRKEGSGAVSHRGIAGVFIHKNMREKGLGTRLMEKAVSEAKDRLGLESVLLGVFEDNEAAVGLYEKLGFEEIGRIKEGLKDPDGKLKDCILMQKKLE